MAARTTLAGTYPEKTTALLAATILDADGVTPLASADSVLLTFTVTLYEERTGTILNSRTAQSVKGVNGGVVSSDGSFTLRLDAADMACLTNASAERHIACFEWTWGSPVKTGHHEIAFTVVNLSKVT
jgi:hypothetical protein